MNSFSFDRFLRFARWTLEGDKRYYIKTSVQLSVVLAFLYLVYTSAGDGDYRACTFMTWVMLAAIVIAGGNYMFHSFEQKDSMRQLLVVPASNLEKFIMRYSTWILVLPLFVLSICVADGIQYVVNMVRQMPDTTSVVGRMMDQVATKDFHLPLGLFLLCLWLHSFILLGVNFFRSRKFAWVFTLLAILLLMVLVLMPMGAFTGSSRGLFYQIGFLMGNFTKAFENVIGIVASLLLTALNTWLAYRLFCHWQLRGRFVNTRIK